MSRRVPSVTQHANYRTMNNSKFLNLEKEEIDSYFQYLVRRGLKFFPNYLQRVNADTKFVINLLEEMPSHDDLTPISCAWNDESDEVYSNSDTCQSNTENESSSESEETEQYSDASLDSECEGVPESLDESGEEDQPEYECSEDNEYYEDLV